MSSACAREDLSITRTTFFFVCGVAAFTAGDGVGSGFIALSMLDWAGVAGLLTDGRGAAVTGFCDGLLIASEAALVGSIGLAAAVVLVILAVGAGVDDGVVTKYSCALKTFKQEPQRTAPLADCSWLGVTRNAVPHLGQRVIIWLLAEVMVYLLLTHGGP